MQSSYSNEAFRRNIARYVSGRAANALVSFLLFLWIARVLAPGQYAVYVAAYSVLELALIVSGLGMEWVTTCFVPVAKLKASGRALIALVWRCAAIQVVCLTLGAALMWTLSPLLSAALGIGDATPALRTYAIVMLIEGASRLCRDQLLSALLLQGAAQASQMCRTLSMAGLAAWAFRSPDWQTARVLALVECAASAASLAVGAAFLFRALYPTRANAQREPWESPTWTVMLRVGRDAWIGNLANLTWSPQVVILLVARSADAEATAVLGFARNLSDFVRRYMPMEFLASVFRTFVVARYATDHDTRRMGAMLGLAYKINLLFLLPILALVVVNGGDLFAAIGHGGYRDARWLVAGWLMVTVAWAHRRIADLLAFALDLSSVPRSASLRLIGTPVAIYLCAQFLGLYSFFLVLFLAEAAYCASVVRAVNRRVRAYRFDWAGMAKFGLGLAAAIAVLLLTHPGSSAFYLACDWVLAAVAGYGVIFLSRGWTGDEAALIGQLRRQRSRKGMVTP